MTFSAASASSVSVSKQEWYSVVFAIWSPALVEWVGLLEVYRASVVELTLVLSVVLEWASSTQRCSTDDVHRRAARSARYI